MFIIYIYFSPQFKLSRRYFSNRIMKTCSRRASYGQQKSLLGKRAKNYPGGNNDEDKRKCLWRKFAGTIINHK